MSMLPTSAESTSTSPPLTNRCLETLLAVVRREAQIAVGCTEPAMVALAAAKARDLADEPPLGIEVTVSIGVLKNAQAVGLPQTRRKGLDMAAALGAFGGRPESGLRILETLTPEEIAAAEAFVDAGKVRVACDAAAAGLLARVEVGTASHRAAVTIAGSHTNVTAATLDGRDIGRDALSDLGRGRGESVAAAREAATGEPGAGDLPAGPAASDRVPLEALTDFDFATLYAAVMSADVSEVMYLVEGAEQNYELARAALGGRCREAAPDYTRSLRQAVGGLLLGGDLVSELRLWTAAAVSARMGGTPWPVLTSGGSGNQGILVSLPVLLVARRTAGGRGAAAGGAGADSSAGTESAADRERERLARALLLAHAVNLYLKAFCGELSAVCGTVTGGAGVAAATCWLLGGDQDQVERAVQMVIGSLYAAVCDGAKGSCALKIGEGATSGVIAGQVARNGGFIEPGEGLVGRNIDETVRLLGRLTREVINNADRLMTQCG